MRFFRTQVIAMLILSAIGGYGSFAYRPESEGSRPKKLDQPERAKPEQSAVSQAFAASLIDEAIERNSSDAAAQLVAAGTVDPQIVSLLLRRLETSKGRPTAIAILARIGEPAAMQAAALLDDDRADVRWSALRLLLCVERPPPSLTSRIVRRLRDEDVWVRRWAAMLLARIDHRACAAELLAASRDPDAEVRWRVLRALQQSRPLSDLPERLQRDALSDVDPDVRFVASGLYQSTVVDRQP
jgi:HEAT repeat protein